MKATTRGRLDAMLDQYDELHHEPAAPGRVDSAPPVTSWEGFAAEVLMPTLDGFAMRLREAGHEALVAVLQETRASGVDLSLQVTVGLRVRPRGTSARNVKPELTFARFAEGRRVAVYYSLPTSSGPWGEFDVGEISADILDTKILAWLGALFTGRRTLI